MPNDLDNPQGTERLLDSLRELIRVARQKALRAVDLVQVQTNWEIGRHIVEFEQGRLPAPNSAVSAVLRCEDFSRVGAAGAEECGYGD